MLVFNMYFALQDKEEWKDRTEGKKKRTVGRKSEFLHSNLSKNQ